MYKFEMEMIITIVDRETSRLSDDLRNQLLIGHHPCGLYDVGASLRQLRNVVRILQPRIEMLR